MYDLNREVAEKLKVSLRVFDYELPIAATTVNMRAVEKLCAKQIHPLMLDNDIFSDVLSLADQLGCEETSSTMSRWLCVRLCSQRCGDCAYRL
jgi:hypothetical protein